MITVASEQKGQSLQRLQLSNKLIESSGNISTSQRRPFLLFPVKVQRPSCDFNAYHKPTSVS